MVSNWREVDVGVVFFFTVDGTHFKINEPTPFSTEWSSQKLGGHAGLNYEIALAIWDTKLLWVHGPTKPGKVNDITVFRGEASKGLTKSLKEKVDAESLNLGRQIRGIADQGYLGEPDYLSTRNKLDPPELFRFKDRALSRQETFNAMLKTFAILANAFRHGYEYHGVAFEAVCAVTMYKLEAAGGGLFDAYP
jgi:hypothetical protein